MYEISYGKARVPFYRVYARPLSGVTPIPESLFSGRENTLFAMEVDVEVFGDNFLRAYVDGDNTNVVATDSMKNFVLQQALAFDGATLEGFLALLGRQFLGMYAQMEALRLSGRELPFVAVPVPQGVMNHARTQFAPTQDAPTHDDSDVLFRRSRDDYGVAVLDFVREGDGAVITGHRCGRVGLQLLKVRGSSFTHFVRDAYTTLPERVDRALFIYLDVHWKYADVADMLAPDLTRYVAAEQVRDLVQVVFHEFVSESIQHLVHEMGRRLLARFPQVAEVSFEAQNRTRDVVAVSEVEAELKVYSDPLPAYGVIKLTMGQT